MKKLDVARMMIRMKLVPQGVTNNQGAASAQQWFPPVGIQQVTHCGTLNQNGIHDRIYRVGAQIRDSDDQDVALAVDWHAMLLIDARHGLLIHAFGITSPNTGR